MPITLIDPTTHALWDDLIQHHCYSSIFHTPQWLRALTDTYQFELMATVKTDRSGQPVAGIPFALLNDQRGKRIISLPFSDFTDALVHNAEEWDELLEPLLDQNCPIVLRQLHNIIPLQDKRFELTNRAKWHGIDLQPEVDELWQGLHHSARRAIRKSQRDGIQIRIAEKDELHTFYDLHLGVRKYKYQLLAQPYPFFENIWQNLVEAGHGLIFFAEYEGTVIGTLFFLCWGDTFTYKFSATKQDELIHRPTDIMLWEAMLYGKEHGFKTLDLGLSDWDQEGLLRFKRKYASEEKTISFLRHTPKHFTAPVDHFGSTLGQLTNLFTRPDVPDEVTEEAGNLLYRFFT
jgi:CelD/BcsL family acetyltransferase involved in cellulose biosynthesis